MSITIVFKHKKVIFDKLMDKNYKEYLSSETWQQKREEIKLRANGCCEKCGEEIGNKGIGHHENYENLFNEKLEDLKYICWSCNDNEVHG